MAGLVYLFRWLRHTSQISENVSVLLSTTEPPTRDTVSPLLRSPVFVVAWLNASSPLWPHGMMGSSDGRPTELTTLWALSWLFVVEGQEGICGGWIRTELRACNPWRSTCSLRWGFLPSFFSWSWLSWPLQPTLDAKTLGMARSALLSHLLKHEDLPCPNELQVGTRSCCMQNEVTDLIAKTHGTRPVGRTDREYGGLKSHNHYTFSLSFCIL